MFKMKSIKRPVLIALIILNIMMLLGQLWPEGAPPFASIVNITTLIFNLILLIFLAGKTKSN